MSLVTAVLLSTLPAGRGQTTLERQIGQLDGTSTRADVLRVLGPPREYRWGTRTFPPDRLPERCIMAYPDGLGIVLSRDRIVEVRLRAPGYRYCGCLGVGDSLERVLEILGPADREVRGQSNSWEDSVLYRDIDGQAGRGYLQRADLGVRLFLEEDRVSALYLTQLPPPCELVATLSPCPRSWPSLARHPPPATWGKEALMRLPRHDPASRDPWQLDLRTRDLSGADLRSSLADLLQASFDDRTIWPAEFMPRSFDPAAIMALGRDPGLGLRALHARGQTGAGIGVAVIDQPLLVEHQEFADRLRLYEEIGIPVGLEAQMHGLAVASIAVGRTVGVAPEAELYYIATSGFDHEKGEYDYTGYARAVRRILQLDPCLPRERHIRVISMSIGWRPGQTGYDDIMAACAEARAAGMLVLSSSLEEVHGLRFHGLGRPAVADPDEVISYEPGHFWRDHARADAERLLVPMDSRATASPHSPAEYVFYRQGGWSWCTPYLAGLYALAAQVDPAITPERFWDQALATGHPLTAGGGEAAPTLGMIVDPAALLAALTPCPLEPFADVRRQDLSSLDLRRAGGILDTLGFNQETRWPPAPLLPEGFDPQQLLEQGMNPGLGLRELHAAGVTGAGVQVGLIDQPLRQDHPEYAGKIRSYHDTGCGGSESSMHGPGMASLLVGTHCGTAPGAQLHVAVVPSWKRDATYYARALDWLVERSRSLEEGPIRVVSVSSQPSGEGSVYEHQDLWDEAVARAEAAGLLVLDCTWHHGFVSLGWLDPADRESVAACTPGFRNGEPEADEGHLHVPTAPRTTAEAYAGKPFGYAYDGGGRRSRRPRSKGGYSDAIPYCAGVLALGWQIRPDLSPREMRELLFASAHRHASGALIIDPPAFLERVRRE